jgi:HD-like signal output (HDOD) protein
MTHQPRELLESYVEVSSLPMIYHRISEAVNDPLMSMANIGKIISDDPGLTARLLRLVNSAFYGFPSKIETITQALVIIGTRQLCDLALGTSVMTMFKGIPEDLVNMESFWRHSIACGIAAKTLAVYRRETNIERFFVSGMIHDIGRLVIYKKIGDQAREVLLQSKSNGTLLFLAEREAIGFDHATLGRLLLQSWNLPSSIVEAVAFHHQPREARYYPVEAAIVHVADLIVNAMQLGSSGERFAPPLDGQAWESLGLSTSILSSTLDHLGRYVNDMVHSILIKR